MAVGNSMNTMTHIEYKWRAKTSDPREIVSVAIRAEQVPRVGELVTVDVPINDKESAYGSGRVSQVHWNHKHNGFELELSAVIFLYD